MGFCSVRIDLDEGDVESQLAFFFKLFDGVFNAACEMSAFGGTEGQTYDRYLDMTHAYAVPDVTQEKEKLFCPLVFPIQYAKAMAANIAGPGAGGGMRGRLHHQAVLAARNRRHLWVH